MSNRVFALVLIGLMSGGSACLSRTTHVDQSPFGSGGAAADQNASPTGNEDPSKQADSQVPASNAQTMDSATPTATGLCGVNSTADNGTPLDVGDQPWRMLPVPSFSGASSLVRVPDGWMAVSGMPLLAEKVITGSASALYWSANGIDWDLIPVQLGGEAAYLQSLAYGNGHYVMISGIPAETWHSTDGRHWTQAPQGLESGYEWGSVAYAGDKFIASGFTLYGISNDGLTWEQRSLEVVQAMGVSFGNGLYMIAGSGPVATSRDALEWTSHQIDCKLPGVCNVDPSGGTHTFLPSLVFGGDCFYAGTLASADGTSWEIVAPLAVHAYVDSTFLHFDGSIVYAWKTGQVPQEITVTSFGQDEDAGVPAPATDLGLINPDAPPPEHISFAFDDGLSCKNARCVAIGRNLFLIPPSGM